MTIQKIKGGVIYVQSTVTVNGKTISIATWNLTGDKAALLKQHDNNLLNAEALYKDWKRGTIRKN